MDSINVRVAKRLLEIKAVFLRPQEPFTWASGIKSQSPVRVPEL